MNRYTVLLVEDCPDFTYVVKRYLEQSRYSLHVKNVESLREAKNILQVDSFDLIILDLNLNDSFGLQSLSSVLELAPNTAIVVLTGLEEEDLGIEAIQLGAQDFIAKDNLNEFNIRRIAKYAVERQKLKNKASQTSSPKQAFKSYLDLEKYVGNSNYSEETNKAYKKFIEASVLESKYSELIDKSMENITNYKEFSSEMEEDVKDISKLLKESGLNSNQFVQMHQSMIKKKLQNIEEAEAFILQSASNVTLLKLTSSLLKD